MNTSQTTNSPSNILETLTSVEYYPVLGFPLDSSNTIKLDISNNNPELANVDLTNTGEFTNFIERIQSPYKVGIGGYLETRHVYKRSSVFGNTDEARSLHLGIDIWAPALTKVFAPINGRVHSFNNNDRFGDYGATIILEHRLNGLTFHTLYGHLSANSLRGLAENQEIKKGQEFCEFGIPEENGQWPPHLHFQLIVDMQNKKGDYPGVASQNDRAFYSNNCPDPNLILNCPVLRD